MCFVWWEVIHTVALTDIYTERYMSPPGALHIDTDYVAPPEVVCSAPTDMYQPGPVHNTGRYMRGHFPDDRSCIVLSCWKIVSSHTL